MIISQGSKLPSVLLPKQLKLICPLVVNLDDFIPKKSELTAIQVKDHLQLLCFEKKVDHLKLICMFSFTKCVALKSEMKKK